MSDFEWAGLLHRHHLEIDITPEVITIHCPHSKRSLNFTDYEQSVGVAMRQLRDWLEHTKVEEDGN